MTAANCKLNNLEYLALQMLIRPGQSGRFYLRKLHQYRFPIQHKSHPKSNFGAVYLAPSGKYFGKLWKDDAKCTVDFYSFSARGKRPQGDRGLIYKKPVKSQGYLTPSGLDKALNAAVKIGLSEEDIDQILRHELQAAADGPPRSKKDRLIAWWKAQPECVALRTDLVQQYGIISGWLNEDGSPTGNKWHAHSMSYASITVGNIIRSAGFPDHMKAINPKTGRKVLAFNLDFRRRQPTGVKSIIPIA